MQNPKRPSHIFVSIRIEWSTCALSPLLSHAIKTNSFTCDHMAGWLVTTATPQTLLGIRDVMAIQYVMRLGIGGLRRRGVAVLLRGEKKVDLINHRVLRHRRTASRYRCTASPLVAIISVADHEMTDFCLGHARVLPSLHLDSFVF